ncbi:MAG: hypothetical protein M1399_09895 [Actinobacteria bacterium]|nr:hypothetical protein [Actinomycetota bacterium]MCL5446076.1 hypothetical protein [Actinomycetota bacterium]
MKVVGALAVVGANAVCVGMVVRRHWAMRPVADHAVTDERRAEAFSIHTRSIHWLIYAVTPIGLGVFAIGVALLR